MFNRSAEVIVIGGGVIGASIAYYLAREKVGVILIEKKGLASGSSGACDGFVTMQSKKPGRHLELARASVELFPGLARELAHDIEFEQHGCLVVIEEPAELEAMKEFVEQRRSAGLDVELLDARQVRELEPRLSPDILGATYVDSEGQVNPMALALGLGLGARDLGAELILHQPVVGLERSGDRIVGVRTEAGFRSADVVINAAGAHAPDIGRLAGLEIPIKPRRGQLLVSRAVDPALRCCLISAGYIAAKHNPELAEKVGQGVSIEQTASGNFLLGSTREFVGYDRRTSLAGLKSIARRTARIIPMLKSLSLIRAFAGLRPYTPDGLPILGRVPGLDGFMIAAGHEGDGVALAPITGKLIAQLVTRGETDLPLDAFRPDRFPGLGGRTDA